MNPNEQWSCYASMATLACEAEVCERVCWNAIRKSAAAKYILRHTARRERGSKYKVTHIAVHPNYRASRNSEIWCPTRPQSEAPGPSDDLAPNAELRGPIGR